MPAFLDPFACIKTLQGMQSSPCSPVDGDPGVQRLEYPTLNINAAVCNQHKYLKRWGNQFYFYWFFMQKTSYSSASPLFGSLLLLRNHLGLFSTANRRSSCGTEGASRPPQGKIVVVSPCIHLDNWTQIPDPAAHPCVLPSGAPAKLFSQPHSTSFYLGSP